MSDEETIWISAKLDTWAEVIFVAAHEAQHILAQNRREDTADLVAKCAADDWSGKRVVYIHHGPCASDWMPPEVKSIPYSAVVLELDRGDAFSSVNTGTATSPRWRRMVIP